MSLSQSFIVFLAGLAVAGLYRLQERHIRISMPVAGLCSISGGLVGAWMSLNLPLLKNVPLLVAITFSALALLLYEMARPYAIFILSGLRTLMIHHLRLGSASRRMPKLQNNDPGGSR